MPWAAPSELAVIIAAGLLTGDDGELRLSPYHRD
jgi:hypothetical protein